MQSPEIASFPALKTPGWGFHDFDGSELVSARALAQIKALTYFALRKGPARNGDPFTFGHVVGGIEHVRRGVAQVFVFLVPAPVGISVLTTTPPIGILQLEEIPFDGYRDGDFLSKARTLGYKGSAVDAAKLYAAPAN